MHRIYCLVGVLFLGIVFSITAQAQDYQVLPLAAKFDPKMIIKEPAVSGDQKKAAALLRKRTSEQQQNARTVFRTGQINVAFDAYYKQVVVPELTRYDKASLQSLTERRERLILDFARSVRNAQVRGFLIKDVFFPELTKIVSGAFHPAVRYNAMIMLGELDEVAGKHGAKPPRPYRALMPFFLDQFKKLSAPEVAYLKFGAFKSMARIASIDAQSIAANRFLPGAERTQVVAIYKGLLGAKPADLPQDLFVSMQRTAVEILGYYGDPSDADAMLKLVEDPATSLWTKLAAAKSYSKLKTQTMDAAKLDKLSTAIAQLMHDALVNEVNAISGHQKRIAVLAARAKEVGKDPTAGKTFGSGSGAGASEDDRSSGLSSGGGSSPDGGAGGGGMMPGSGGGSGAGAGSGRSGGGARKGSTELGEVPSYRIEIARRRIKTLSSGLFSAFGETDDSTQGLMRWATGNGLKKLSTIKGFMKDADLASESGLGDNDAALVAGTTDTLKKELRTVAKAIASHLGGGESAVSDPAKPDAGKPDTGKSGDTTKGGGFEDDEFAK